MRLFLYLFYSACKYLILFCFRIFYRKKIILHPERTKITKPTIVVSNHPSTLLDPLLIASLLNVHPHFLINAGLVEHWLGNWFFNTFYCIPVKRAKDTGDRKVNNIESLGRAIEFLSGGGSIYIAPEGVSNMERRLQSIKTGLARIALAVENENDFKLGLQIQAFGINYTAPRFFRSSVIVNCGAPFTIEKYKEIYEQKPREAVRQLTKELADRLRPLLINTTDPEEEQMLTTLGKIFQAKEPLPLQEQFFRSKKKLQIIQDLRTKGEEEYELWKEKAKELDERLSKKKTDQLSLFTATEGSLKKNNKAKMFRLLYGLPFFLYGWINNFLSNFFPGFLAKAMNIYKGYDGTIKILSSWIFYPLFYGLQLYFIHWLFGRWIVTLIYFLSLYPLGIFAWNYRQTFIHWEKERFMLRWQKVNPKELKELADAQKELLAKF